MKLTIEQRSEIISEMASIEVGFNELMRVLLKVRELSLHFFYGESVNAIQI